jgi:hypothetical protein
LIEGVFGCGLLEGISSFAVWYGLFIHSFHTIISWSDLLWLPQFGLLVGGPSLGILRVWPPWSFGCESHLADLKHPCAKVRFGMLLLLVKMLWPLFSLL